jgi:hypothetical protein
VKKSKSKHLDFVINSRPLTKEEEAGISAYIKNYKLKNSSAVTQKIKKQAKIKMRLLG